MRLRSDVWVMALIRRVNGEGDFAAIERKGAAEAGAIFIKVEPRDRSCKLYGPAPSVLIQSSDSGDRYFVPVRPDSIADPLQAREYLDKEMRFDSDLWIVGIESDCGENYFEIAETD
jgi:hypothetical protein